MPSSFKTGVVFRRTVFGVLVNMPDGQRLIKNGLNKAVPLNSEVLVARKDNSEQIIARRG